MSVWRAVRAAAGAGRAGAASAASAAALVQQAELAERAAGSGAEDERPEALQRARNKSRLSAPHYNLTHGRRPYEEPMCLAHRTIKYHRRLYGRFGAASGVNPSLCWPTRKEMADTREYERVAYPFTIQQMAAEALEKKQEQKKKIEEREMDIMNKLSKLEQWKKELNDKLSKKAQEVQAAKMKKERLVDEVRRHFGFKLDPRDERFQEMLVKREKEQKKLEKVARKEAKEKQMMAKLQQKTATITDNTSQ